VYSVTKLSQNRSNFEEDLQSFIDKYIILWHSSSTQTPASTTIYTTADQRANERETNQLIDLMDMELQNYPSKE